MRGDVQVRGHARGLRHSLDGDVGDWDLGLHAVVGGHGLSSPAPVTPPSTRSLGERLALGWHQLEELNKNMETRAQALEATVEVTAAVDSGGQAEATNERGRRFPFFSFLTQGPWC